MPSNLPDEKIYKYHVANIRSVEIAINHTSLSARKAISEKNVHARDSFVRLYALLIGLWAENRLKKLLFEKNAFSEEERRRILSQSTHIDQWNKTVEVSFRKHFNVPNAPLSKSALPLTTYSQFLELTDIIDKNLRSVIEIRNKLAHGQWIYPFNSNETDIETSKYQILNKDNLQSLQYKYSLLSSLSQIIHDLVISLPTFKRDFDKHYKHINSTINNLKNRKYTDYERDLIEKRERGIQRRKENTKHLESPIYKLFKKLYNRFVP